MRNKLCALLLAGTVLALTGCRLARPERENGFFGDRFAGVYAVYDREENRVTDETLTESGGPNTIQVNRSSFWSSDNPLLTELGTEDIDLGKYGVHALPRLVLIGQYDEEKHEYTFPGLPGYSLFSTTTYEEAGAPCTSSVSDMAEASFRLSVTDNGTTDEMEGTLYMGPPADAGPHWDPLTDADGVWTFYRVYQAPDGTVYLDSGGDSFRGGGGFSTTQTATQKTTDSEGQVTEETVSVRVSVEAAPRLTQLAVSQFDSGSQLLSRQEISLDSPLPSVAVLPDAAWVLVEEISASDTARAVYNAPREDPVLHPVVLLDDAGVGRVETLEIQ